MKIGIITLHRVLNYGSVLQTYATQRVFEKLGVEVFIIDYISERNDNKALYWQTPIKDNLIKTYTYRFARMPITFFRKRKFMRFLKHYVVLSKPYHHLKSISKDPPQADIYVTGSDQCWNSFYNGVDKAFYLQFGEKNIRRVSFSTSVGNEEFTENEKAEIAKYLAQYQYVTVREKATVDMVRELTDAPVTDVIDPTLQLTSSEWNKIASGRLIKEKYLLLFILYGEDIHATEYARKIADEKGLIVVEVLWKYQKKPEVDIYMRNRKPEDFLALIRDAEYVVTNSFHGLSFCINFNKQFTVIARSQFNNRITNLLDIVGLQDRMVCQQLDMDVVNKMIDYTPVNEILSRERQRAAQVVDALIKIEEK